MDLKFCKYILESLDTGIIVIDESENLRFANIAAEEMLVLSLKSKIGRPSGSLMKGPVGSLLKQSLRFGMSQQQVYVNIGSKNLSVHTQAIFNNETTVGAALALIEDVSEKVKLRTKLKVSDSLAIVGQLTASIAHEIKNPLASISGAAQLLKEENGNPGNKNIMIDLMIRETERLTETIDYFLDFANEKPLSLDYFNIDEMIEQVAETMKLHSYFHDGIKMKLVCRSKPLLILGDRKQLTQVLTNIFLNALQAIKGDGEIIVDYGLNKLKNAVVIKISDTGIGMSPEIISRIFEPFVSSRETGMGLGLPITKKIVEKHSGSITVSSKKGDGATFEITLPVSG